MNGYRYFMKNANLKIFILLIILIISHEVYAGCPWLIESNTNIEIAANKTGKGVSNFITLKWKNLDFDEKMLQYIKVYAIKNQGLNGYFNPKIKVCNYEGNKCHELYSGTSCWQIYGTQDSGAGVSAAVFIDWEGNKTKPEIEIADGLKWTWAENVTDDEKKKFATAPKICACSQKADCTKHFWQWNVQISKGENIFYPGELSNVCDTCEWSQGQQKIKCAPIPLEPGPPPFCDQLQSSLPKIKVVPVQNNDYFEPQLRVIGGNLKEAKHLGFSNHSQEQRITQDSHTYYFKTERKDNQLCAEYYGTKEIKKENLEFTRCFLSPEAPQPQEIKLANNGLTFTIKMKKEICKKYGHYNGEDTGICAIQLFLGEKEKKVGPLSFKIITPEMRNTKNDNDKVDSHEKDYKQVFKEILKNSNIFNTLKQYDCTPKVIPEKKSKGGLDKNGYPNLKFIYKEKDKQGKMLCVSGWKPQPDELISITKQGIVKLKSLGSTYAKYKTVYSEESKQTHYIPDDSTGTNLLDKTQTELDAIIFDNKGYILMPGQNTCVVDKDEEVIQKAQSSNCTLAYKLIDQELKERCNKEQSTCTQEDGYSCNNGNECVRSTKYITKNGNKPFYLPLEKQEDTYVKKRPIMVDTTEVFYADDLCTFDLQGLKENINSIMEKYLKIKKSELESKNNKTFGFHSSSNYTGNLSQYKYVEIEAWGGGEAGHIKSQAHSIETRIGKPGDYIKAKLEVDHNYPSFRIRVTEGGGGIKDRLSNKDGGPTIIEKCSNSDHNNCIELITIRGGGNSHEYGGVKYNETKIHRDLRKGEDLRITKGDDQNYDNKNKEIAYIENYKINFDTVNTCEMDDVSNRYGAGGCIDTKDGAYGKGASGGAIIKPIIEEIPIEEIRDTIGKLLEDKNSNTLIESYDVIQTLDTHIHKTIKEKIQDQLSCKD